MNTNPAVQKSCFSFCHPAHCRAVSDLCFRGRVLRPVFWRRLGPGAAIGPGFFRAAFADCAGTVRNRARQTACISREALLPLPLRLPRGVAAVHKNPVWPELAAGNGTASGAWPG